mgnify:CR=1 FL=1
MRIFEILNIQPEDVKVHLAVWNGRDDPLDLYFDGSFKEWQEHQNKRNFQRKYILSLIKLAGENEWLFAGVYISHEIDKTENGYHFYRTELSHIGEDLKGRLVISYKRNGRNSYPNGESLENSALVHEVKPEPITFSDFQSFKEVVLTRQQLELLYKHEYPSWKSALSSVAGVYLISDRLTGKLYVGSAYGVGGFWGRWSDYYSNFHGGNIGFKTLYQSTGVAAFEKFSYSILETCDIDLPAESVIKIENRWKEKLLSREFGYNEN